MVTYIRWKDPISGYPSAMHEQGVEPLTSMHEEEGLVVEEVFEADTWEEALAYSKTKSKEFFDDLTKKH